MKSLSAVPVLVCCNLSFSFSSRINSGHTPRDQERIENARRVVNEVYTNKKQGGRSISARTQISQMQQEQGSLRQVASSTDHSSDAERRQAGSVGPGPSSQALQAAMQLVGVARHTMSTSQDPTAARLSAVALNASRNASRMNTSVRCLCGASGQRPIPSTSSPAMIQCLGETCGVWQHCVCACHVQIAAAGSNAPPPRNLPENFFCDVCRSARTDPFWEVISNDILPIAPLRKTGKQVLVR